MTNLKDLQQKLERAVLLHRNGHTQEAAKAYQKILARFPAQPDALNLLAVLHNSEGSHQKALGLLNKAAAVAPSHASIRFNRASVHLALKNVALAEADYRAAITLQPNSIEARLNLGALLFDNGRREDAVDVLRDATLHCSSDPRAFYNLGCALSALTQIEPAEAAFKQALQLSPRHSESMIMLGKLAAERNQFDEALSWVTAALDIDPTNSLALTNQGSYLAQLDRTEDAIAVLNRAVELAPQNPNAKVNRAIAYLSIGQLANGWSDFALRSDTTGSFQFHKRRFPWPAWKGETLANKKILLWTEQGLGDEILFAGMVTEVLSKAREVVIACSLRISQLFADSFPTARVVSLEDLPQLVSAEYFDYQSALMDLGATLRSSNQSFPNRRQHLTANAARVSALREKYLALDNGAETLIGFSWRSFAPHIGADKTPDLAHWTGLSGFSKTLIVSFQHGPAELVSQQKLNFRNVLGIDLRDSLCDPNTVEMSEFAAHLAAMDMIITVSNTNAHLAAALGVPVLLLVPDGRGRLWYWPRRGFYSSWYSSIRVLRSGDALGLWAVAAKGAGSLKL